MPNRAKSGGSTSGHGKAAATGAPSSHRPRSRQPSRKAVVEGGSAGDGDASHPARSDGKAASGNSHRNSSFRRGRGGGGAASESARMADAKESKEHTALLKRVPMHFPAGKTDLYISRNSDFQGQYSRAERLLSQKHMSITIHGLGAAINRAINLAMQLQQKSPIPLVISATTDTVPLVDDLLPTKELMAKAAVERTQIRKNSAIHITLTKSL